MQQLRENCACPVMTGKNLAADVLMPARSTSTFSSKLIRWQRLRGRSDLPWQNTRDPYAIWVSEIMLQQTRVSAVIPYYSRFLQRFPDLGSLASSSVDDVLALWSGLGYYSRARNLHHAARMIMEYKNGLFPRDIATIRQLPGVGPSTAAAIAAFAYGARYAILDGNVKRVFARYFGLDGYPGDEKIEKALWRKAEELLPEKIEPGDMETYTQALMDLGSIVCIRNNPACAECPVQGNCIALRDFRVAELPTPRPRKKLPQKETTLLMLMNKDRVLLERRPSTGIWGGLWCLPEMPVKRNAVSYCVRHLGLEVTPVARLPLLDHAFTHFKLRIHPRLMRVITSDPADSSDFTISGQETTRYVAPAEALKMAIPAPVRKLLMQHASE
jgi:A/G-specific adenine glycosylase